MIEAIVSIIIAHILVGGLVAGVVFDNYSKERQIKLFTELLRENK